MPAQRMSFMLLRSVVISLSVFKNHTCDTRTLSLYKVGTLCKCIKNKM